MEEACQELDLGVAQATGLLTGAALAKYATSLRHLSVAKEEALKFSHLVGVLEQLFTYLAVTLPENSPALQKVRDETLVQKRQLQAVVGGIDHTLHTLTISLK